VGCGLLVAVQNGRAVAVKGDPDSPVSKGLACVKGYNSVQALYGSDRLTRAKIRREGGLVEVPLGEALDLVARKLQETAQRHGKKSIAVYGSAQWTIPDAYVASKLFKGAGHEQRRRDPSLCCQRDDWPRAVSASWCDWPLRTSTTPTSTPGQSRQSDPILSRCWTVPSESGGPHHRSVHPHDPNISATPVLRRMRAGGRQRDLSQIVARNKPRVRQQHVAFCRADWLMPTDEALVRTTTDAS
jgi:hypothetical protein